jgi:alginate O-acetyltransferase complex protein AlgI
MQFNAFPYLIFLAVAIVLYWCLPQRFRRLFVLAVSLVFYATWGIVFVAVPLVVSAFVFQIGRRLVAASPSNAKHWLWLGISGVLALLIFFKYRDFLLLNVNVLITWIAARPLTFAKLIALPVGISFYTFEAIGYLIDVRQGRVKAAGFMDVCLFFMFWPNVMSGPVVRARELVPQLKFCVKFEPRFIFEGIDRLVWGLVQKNVVANVLGIWVDKGFHPAVIARPSTIDGWFVAVAFGLQIYFDFAGYSNMAIGAARLLGVTLPENFRQPYHAATPVDFWARWHMTLSRWIRDYLFFPINAKWKGASVPLYVSLLAVMTLVGLWHGAGWNFILWGFMHGVYLVLYRAYEAAKQARPALGASPVISGAWRLLTLISVTAAWVPFRSPNMHKTGAILSSMFVHFASGATYSATFYFFTVAIALFCAVEPFLVQKLADVEEHARTDGPSFFRVLGRPLAYACGFLLFMLFDEHNAQFIYSQF